MRLLRHILTALLSLVSSLIIVLAAIYIYLEINLPDVSVLKDVHLQIPLRVYSSDGKLIAEYGNKRCIPVKLNQVPPILIKGVLATEDQRFYSHSGVDFISIVRATKAVVRTGQKVEGASTITMQVARNFFLTHQKTLSRKIREMLLAFKIEDTLSKDKILELYLNKVYFGSHAYGVAAAANIYFGKTLDQLSLGEMATIAGLPQAPSRNNPFSRPQAAKERRDHVLLRLLEVGDITKKQYEEAKTEPLNASYHEQPVELNAPFMGEMVRQIMEQQYGEAAYEQGFSVYTTLSSHLQKTANQALQEGLIAYTERHGYKKPYRNLKQLSPKEWPSILNRLALKNSILQPAAVTAVGYNTLSALLGDGNTITIPPSGLSAVNQHPSGILHRGDVIWIRQDATKLWHLSEIPQIQGALVSLDPQNGSILALTGGFDYNLSQFNRAIQAERQPGSNFKPFIYSAALAKGYTLASIINDAPIVIQQNLTGSNQWWRPQNDDLTFSGPTRLRIGLTHSLNVVSIRLLQQIGISYTLKYLKNFGFDSNKLPHFLSLALGSGVVTPLQIAAGYSIFANGGYQVMPYFIQRIVDQKNQIIFTAKPPVACSICITQPNLPFDQLPSPLAPQTITPQNAYLITQALQDAVQSGTAKGAQVLGRHDLAGKTGTANEKRDAWFTGFNTNIVTTVWVGFDDHRSLFEYGAQSALPIWIQYMKVALADIPEKNMPQPPNIVTMRIDPRTGLLTRTGMPSIFEIFWKPHVPKGYASPSESNGENSYRYDDTEGDNGEDLF